MPSIRQQLPPLDALVMFDAAARHMSFTRAADELNITQAAVSRQIRLLEEDLGIRLFERAHRNVELTPEGRAFQHSVHAALVHLCDATNEIRHMPQANVVIAADQAFVGLWLTPRIADFLQLCPGLSIRIISTDSQEECFKELVDIAIVHGNGHWPGFRSHLLFSEEVFPVCSPDFLEKVGGVNDIASLLDLPLIEHEDDRWDWMNWRVWLTANKIDLPHKHHKLLLNNYAFVVRAAESGHGIALGWAHLVDSSLREGRLVRPIESVIRTKLGYFMVYPDRPQTNDACAQLADWIIKEHAEKKSDAKSAASAPRKSLSRKKG